MIDTENTSAPALWTAHMVPVFKGLFDTRIDTGEDYDTKPLGELFAMQPWNKPKTNGPAFVPSLHHDYDAREHSAQREKGAYVCLAGDIDSGDHPKAAVTDAVQAFAGSAAWLVYSSPHSRPGDQRWRILIPLGAPIPFDTWHDAQTAFFAFMEARGLAMDHALARAAQPVFLPNVPDVHAKSGTKLRGDDGAPLYYATASARGGGLTLDSGPIAEGIAALRRKRLEDDAIRDRIRKEAEARRAAMPRGDGASLMEDFNASTSVATMLEMCGYEQSPRSAEDWRSPHQTGETYATRVIGSKWVSLSASDTSAGLGEKCKTGCFGDAYDLYVHFKHGGDHKAAYRALGQERRDANVVYLPQAEPPEWMEHAPPYEEPPEWAEAAQQGAPEPEYEEPADDVLPVFHPADWHNETPPQREWRWDSFLPDNQASLLTGAGASGKSLATQQMATCIAMGLPFLGVDTKRCPALYITCEDDLTELHRRQDAICESLGISPESTRGHLFVLSLQGEIGNELATFNNEGEMSLAPRFGQIERTCAAYGIRHVTIDNTAHTFAGNENDRHQVAAFVNLNNRLAQLINGSVLIVGHPNKAGDSYSGSTAWENQVRSRLYLEIPKRGDDEAPIDPDMRLLRNEKANYSQRGSEVHFWWHRGAFVTERPQGEPGQQDASQAFEDNLFLDLLDRLKQQRRHVTHAPNLPNYAPKIMAAMPEAGGISKGAFARAMERLFATDTIIGSQPLWKGRDRHPVLGLARKS